MINGNTRNIGMAQFPPLSSIRVEGQVARKAFKCEDQFPLPFIEYSLILYPPFVLEKQLLFFSTEPYILKFRSPC